ncbi:MAG: Ig-like domain-containing protein [Gemmatimonadaceae bacterium]|nr:Ig-like domain-containing protein [Gemmatimonadaceae bacterium]
MSVARRRLFRACAVTVLLVLTSCGGGSGPSGPSVPVTPVEALPVLTTLAVVLPEGSVPAGQTIEAAVAALDHRGRAMTVGLLTWLSSDPAVATVDSRGVVLAMSPGTATISATVGDVRGSRVITVTDPPPGPLPVASVRVAPFITTIDIGATQPLAATLQDFAGRELTDREVSWTTSDASIAVVSADGVVTARGAGTAIIEVESETRRAAASVTVLPTVDTSIVVLIPVPVPNEVIEDSLTVVASVRSLAPIDSVSATIAGRSFPMRFGQIPNSDKGPAWSVIADLSTLAFGPHAVIVTGVDVLGRRGVLVVPFIRNPRVPGGNKSPPGSK